MLLGWLAGDCVVVLVDGCGCSLTGTDEVCEVNIVLGPHLPLVLSNPLEPISFHGHESVQDVHKEQFSARVDVAETWPHSEPVRIVLQVCDVSSSRSSGYHLRAKLQIKTYKN